MAQKTSTLLLEIRDHMARSDRKAKRNILHLRFGPDFAQAGDESLKAALKLIRIGRNEEACQQLQRSAHNFTFCHRFQLAARILEYQTELSLAISEELNSSQLWKLINLTVETYSKAGRSDLAAEFVYRTGREVIAKFCSASDAVIIGSEVIQVDPEADYLGFEILFLSIRMMAKEDRHNQAVFASYSLIDLALQMEKEPDFLFKACNICLRHCEQAEMPEMSTHVSTLAVAILFSESRLNDMKEFVHSAAKKGNKTSRNFIQFGRKLISLLENPSSETVGQCFGDATVSRLPERLAEYVRKAIGIPNTCLANSEALSSSSQTVDNDGQAELKSVVKSTSRQNSRTSTRKSRGSESKGCEDTQGNKQGDAKNLGRNLKNLTGVLMAGAGLSGLGTYLDVNGYHHASPSMLGMTETQFAEFRRAEEEA